MSGEKETLKTTAWLERFEKSKEQIAWKTEELNRLKAVATAVGGGRMEGRSAGAAGSRAEEMAERIADGTRELEKLREKQAGTYVEILDAVGKMTDVRERQLLILCYLDGQSLPEAANRMKVSYSLAYELKKRAFTHLKDILN